MTDQNKRIKKNTIRYILVALLLIGAAVAIGKFGIAGQNGNENVPPSFIEARANGAILGSDIVAIYEDVTNSLQEISDKDKEKKYAEALKLTEEALDRVGPNQEAVKKSQLLAVELAKIAEVIPQLKSEDARNLLLEGVTAEVNLVTHLVSYNGYFNELLRNLREKFTGSASGDRVPELIDKMNEEAKVINRLNKQFNEKMDKFDSEYKQS